MDRFDPKTTDPEQALSFYVGCRAAFLNNDRIQRVCSKDLFWSDQQSKCVCFQYAILQIWSLTLHVIRTHRFSTSRSTFVQACIANLFITIPSLRDSYQKVQLSIKCASLGLASLAFLQVNQIRKQKRGFFFVAFFRSTHSSNLFWSNSEALNPQTRINSRSWCFTFWDSWRVCRITALRCRHPMTRSVWIMECCSMRRRVPTTTHSSCWTGRGPVNRYKFSINF